MEKKETVSVGKFSFDIPANWKHQLDESILTIYDDPKGEGAIQISNFDIPEEYEFNLFDEFYDFVSENTDVPKDDYNFYKKIKKIKEDYLSLEIINNKRFFILSMFYHNHSVLFITYNCESEFIDKEKNVIEKFLSGVRIQTGAV